MTQVLHLKMLLNKTLKNILQQQVGNIKLQTNLNFQHELFQTGTDYICLIRNKLKEILSGHLLMNFIMGIGLVKN